MIQQLFTPSHEDVALAQLALRTHVARQKRAAGLDFNPACLTDYMICNHQVCFDELEASVKEAEATATDSTDPYWFAQFEGVADFTWAPLEDLQYLLAGAPTPQAAALLQAAIDLHVAGEFQH